MIFIIYLLILLYDIYYLLLLYDIYNIFIIKLLNLMIIILIEK